MIVALYIGVIMAIVGWFGALLRVMLNRDVPTLVAVLGLTVGILGAIGPIVILLWPSVTENQLIESKEHHVI